MKTLSATFVFILSFTLTHAQETTQKGSVNLGIGAGPDYGGIGVRLAATSKSQQAEGFIGVGYAGAISWNAGVLIRTTTSKTVTPYLTAMYGVNAVVKEALVGGNNRKRTTLYYGPSFGAGLEFRGKKKRNFFSLGALLPIRSKKFDDDTAWSGSFDKPSRILLTVGYHFTFRKPQSM